MNLDMDRHAAIYCFGSIMMLLGITDQSDDATQFMHILGMVYNISMVTHAIAYEDE
jgi:hypothetical protein